MRKKLIVVLSLVLTILVVGLVGWNTYKMRNLEKQIADDRWEEVSDQMTKQDVLTPDVGVMQFVRGNTFTINLEKVDYGTNGLHLHGKIGNATNLYISNLALTFTVTKQIFEMREDFDKADKTNQEMFQYFGSPSIGNAQSSAISALTPGNVQDFDVTIPNVKQAKNPPRIVVTFSGERYGYAP